MFVFKIYNNLIKYKGVKMEKTLICEKCLEIRLKQGEKLFDDVKDNFELVNFELVKKRGKCYYCHTIDNCFILKI